MKLWEFMVNVAALLCFAAMLIKAWVAKSWSGDFIELLFGFGGMVVCLFPYEATQYQGRWGWTHQQWRVHPEGFMKFVGIIFLLLGAFSSFTGSEWLDELIRR